MKTVGEVFNTLDEEQRAAVYYVIGCYVEDGVDPGDNKIFERLMPTLNSEQKRIVDLMIVEAMKMEHAGN